jgi:hypothetical protein
MPSLVASTGNYVSFAHRLLWDSAQRHIRLAANHPEDSWILHLSAALLTAAAFEAYLNYVGGETLPHVWANERQFFSQPKYRGTAGKLVRIAEELGYSAPTRAHKPWAGWLELVNLRDKLVHARPKKVSYRVVHKSTDLPRMPSTWLYREAPATRVVMLIGQTEQLAMELHSLIRASEFQSVVFGGHPFLGALGFGTGGVENVA